MSEIPVLQQTTPRTPRTILRLNNKKNLNKIKNKINKKQNYNGNALSAINLINGLRYAASKLYKTILVY